MKRCLAFVLLLGFGCMRGQPEAEPPPPAPVVAPTPEPPTPSSPRPGPLVDDPFRLWVDHGLEAGSLVPGPCAVFLDVDGDGFPDRRAEYQYDTIRSIPSPVGPAIREARLRSRALDTDGDGALDRRHTSLTVPGWPREIRITETGRGGVDWRITELTEADRQLLGDGTTRVVWRRQISRGAVDRRSVEAVLDERGRVLSRRDSSGSGAAEELSFAVIRCSWNPDGRLAGSTREAWAGLSSSTLANAQDDLAKCRSWDPRDATHLPALWEPWTETAPRPVEGFGKDPPRDRPERIVYDFFGNPLLIVLRNDRWFLVYGCWKP